MASDVYIGKLTYLYRGTKWIVNANLAGGYKEFREINPVYDRQITTYRYGVALLIFKPIRKGKSSILSLFASGEMFREVANEDFFNAGINWINGGIIWRHLRK